MIDLITDSRKIKKGDTFIAIKGVDRDGHDYIQNAIENGASKIICEKGNYSIPTEIIKDTRKYFDEYVYKKYYPLIKDIKLIGITGTSGKTTTAYLTYQILKMLNKKVAYIGTIGFYRNDEFTELSNTTPDTDIMYNMLLECHEKGILYVIMEVSSHSIDKNRIYGLEFDEVAFTNLSQEHLDYHLTMENYAKAKQKLFYKLRNNKVAIVNVDSVYKDYFLLKENNNLTISFNKGDVTVNDINMTNLGITFSFTYNNTTYQTNIHMVGKYNIYNYLEALFLVHKLGIPIEEILKITPNLTCPRGRMEMIKYHTNSIFVDYAHKPDAVLNVLESTNEYKKAKVITIIGCGGNRDKTKRPVMGKIATDNSTYVIFTNDNPRNENEKDIMNDIIAGVDKNNYEIIYDRKKAIFNGLDMLKDKDILLILGKGHEDYQIIKGEKHHLDDKECVLEYINNH